jgi:hypothetical protein
MSKRASLLPVTALLARKPEAQGRRQGGVPLIVVTHGCGALGGCSAAS